MDTLVNVLKSIAEPTRLRILNILLHQELTVSEITEILNYSQPRISRHLKLMCDAGVLDRVQEGSWVFYRIRSQNNSVADLIRYIADFIPSEDITVKRDLARLEEIKLIYAQKAKNYFESNAESWNDVRQLYFSSSKVDNAFIQAVEQHCSLPIEKLIDLGTGTGKILELLGNKVQSATGIDNSQQMLSVARSMLLEKDLSHCQVRQGDINNINIASESADLVTIHHVLHYLSEPHLVVYEATRLLKQSGILFIVDFLSHDVELLRTRFAHRRLGFKKSEIELWAKEVNLEVIQQKIIAEVLIEGETLYIQLSVLKKS